MLTTTAFLSIIILWIRSVTKLKRTEDRGPWTDSVLFENRTEDRGPRSFFDKDRGPRTAVQIKGPMPNYAIRLISLVRNLCFASISGSKNPTIIGSGIKRKTGVRYLHIK